MSATTAKLAETARFLRNAAPQAFNDFHAAFANYTYEKINDMISATENVVQAQAHVQQLRKILDVLEEIKKNG